MRGLGQKYLGIRPESHQQAVFSNDAVQVSGNHPVPISNFMNAQCKHLLSPTIQSLCCDTS